MYINIIMKCSISLAYKDDSSQGYEKQNQSQKHIMMWKYYCLHNASIIIVSSCRLKNWVPAISRS